LRRSLTFNASLEHIKLGDFRAKEFHNKITTHFLRRLKHILGDQLPKKTDQIVFCKMSKLQTKAYMRVLASEEFQAISRAKENCDCNI
jgi:SNF2 family DNA or RNA helicase